jgi:hypothetical protein
MLKSARRVRSKRTLASKRKAKILSQRQRTTIPIGKEILLSATRRVRMMGRERRMLEQAHLRAKKAY